MWYFLGDAKNIYWKDTTGATPIVRMAKRVWFKGEVVWPRGPLLSLIPSTLTLNVQNNYTDQVLVEPLNPLKEWVFY